MSDWNSLVEQIRTMQKTDPAGKQQWIAYTDENGGGNRDPKRHEAEFIQTFLTMYDSGERTQKQYSNLAEQVKEMQRSNPDAKQQWIAYTEKNGGGVRDPNKHDDSFIQKFLTMYESGKRLPQVNGGAGDWGGKGGWGGGGGGGCGGWGGKGGNPMMEMMSMMMGGQFGKGNGGFGGKGGGKSMISATPKERLLWIGGLGEGDRDNSFNKELQQFFNDSVGGCKYVEIRRKGNGAAIFDSEESKNNAIATMNGAMFKNQQLELDVWTSK